MSKSKKKNRSRSVQAHPAGGATRERAIEAGAALPADRAAEAEATGAPIAFRWREWDIVTDPSALDDYDAVFALENGQPSRMLAAVVSDEKTRTEILESMRKEDGKLQLSDVLAAVYSMLESIGQGN